VRGEVYLNGATLMTTPTAHLIEIARAAGYRGIEARAERLLVDPEEARAAHEMVRPGEVWSLNGLRLSLSEDGAFDRATVEAELGPRLQACRNLQAAYLLTVPPRLAAAPTDRAIAGIREALDEVRDLAAPLGIRIGFEFLGFRDCPINTPGLAAQTVEGLEGIELVLDSCHWFTSGSPPLDDFPVERIAMVHLNDAPARPPDEIEDADRVLPGEGVIPLRDLVLGLERRGYRGPWSLETFNPGYWREDPAAVARRGLAAVASVIQGNS
jgi:2-keto-myo-inositol isomerase